MLSKWLRENEIYTTTRKGVSKTFPKNNVSVVDLDSIFDIDLIDFSRMSEKNDGYRYIVICIDIFSRYLWARPLKSKLGSEVSEALISIFKEGRVPKSIRSDSGHDVHNATITKKALKPFGVKQYITHNNQQANYAEHVIKTLKTRIWRYFRFTMKQRWVDVLQNFVTSYNNSMHSSLGKWTPKSVNSNNESRLRLDQYFIKEKKDRRNFQQLELIQLNPRPFKFKLGSTVRIPYSKTKFFREYSEKWSNEVFLVTKRFRRDGLNIYKLDDTLNRPVAGTFYEQELQKVDYNKKGTFFIDRIKKTVKMKGKTYVLVSWYGWPSPDFDTLIPDSSLAKYQN